MFCDVSINNVTLYENELIREYINKGYLIIPTNYSSSNWNGFTRLQKDKSSIIIGTVNCYNYRSWSDEITVVVREVIDLMSSFDFENPKKYSELVSKPFINLKKYSDKCYFVPKTPEFEKWLTDIRRERWNRTHINYDCRVRTDDKSRKLALSLIRKIKGYKSQRLMNIESIQKKVSTNFEGEIIRVYHVVKLVDGKRIEIR